MYINIQQLASLTMVGITYTTAKLYNYIKEDYNLNFKILENISNPIAVEAMELTLIVGTGIIAIELGCNALTNTQIINLTGNIGIDASLAI